MNFTKVQGAGNDFILIETSNPDQHWGEMAMQVCDRHYGIGGDGILLLLPSKNANFAMRIFNSDGSEAEACGNGLRCIVRYAMHRKIIPSEGAVTVETIVGMRTANIKTDDNGAPMVQVAMGKPEFLADKIPVVTSKSIQGKFDINLTTENIQVNGVNLTLYFVSMGNPHAIYFQDKAVNKFSLSEIGALVETHSIFPNKVNFEVARVIDRENIEVAVWERGAGITLACGTGACATAVASQLLDYTDKTSNVALPGGLLNVEWNGTDEVLLSGPTEIVFSGTYGD